MLYPILKILEISGLNTHCECVFMKPHFYLEHPLNLLIHRGVFRHHREN